MHHECIVGVCPTCGSTGKMVREADLSKRVSLNLSISRPDGIFILQMLQNDIISPDEARDMLVVVD